MDFYKCKKYVEKSSGILKNSFVTSVQYTIFLKRLFCILIHIRHEFKNSIFCLCRIVYMHNKCKKCQKIHLLYMYTFKK